MYVIPDQLMFLAVLVTMSVTTWYGYVRKNWMMLAIDVSLFWLLLFFGALSAGLVDQDDINVRLALYRPGFFFLLLFLTVFLINGHLNRFIDRLLLRTRQGLTWVRTKFKI